METQEELKKNTNTSFNDRYPVWKCPDCGWLNRYIDTFFEFCTNCNSDHTADWEAYVIKQHKSEPEDSPWLNWSLKYLNGKTE